MYKTNIVKRALYLRKGRERERGVRGLDHPGHYTSLYILLSLSYALE